MHRPRLAALGALGALGLTVTLAACGGDDGEDEDFVDTSSIASLLLTSEDAPSGYSWNSVAEVLEGAGDDLGQQLDASAASVTTSPENCAALVPTADDLLAEIYDHSDTVGAIEFLPDDEDDPAVIDAVVSIADDGDTALLAGGDLDVDQCGEFTRTYADGSVTNYRANAQKASIAATDDTTVITVLSDSATEGEEITSTVTGTVDGVHFRITAVGVTDTDVVTSLAEAQVARITGVREGQD
ncbi:hypothetical protein [Corynebacterium terpenotabidum]|uniref:Secreted protein n=1 Tax=Corynebacterium terpenotabidum Y-11 TaxID=1200352 RepID=S4XEV2_9CORY|nr:hypothetical protein [Corynebacterium terpenotabidum]AGP30140.1 hypothetical protein A606_02435 [Corynebacterium terpenotabidum Y-11]